MLDMPALLTSHLPGSCFLSIITTQQMKTALFQPIIVLLIFSLYHFSLPLASSLANPIYNQSICSYFTAWHIYSLDTYDHITNVTKRYAVDGLINREMVSSIVFRQINNHECTYTCYMHPARRQYNIISL